GVGAAVVIPGIGDGVIDMGAVARALPAALDEAAAEFGARREPANAASPVVPEPARPPNGPSEMVLVASSTGGPSALTRLLCHLGPPKLPVIVAQHMPADQTSAFARHLAAESGLDVVER